MNLEKPLYRSKIILAFLLFILFLTIPRICWLVYFSSDNPVTAKKGIIDLRDIKFDDTKTIGLNGEWLFYPNAFLPPHPSREYTKQHFAKVPGGWDSNLISNSESAKGYSTYRLKILLPEEHEQYYGLRLKDVHTFANIYVSGKLRNKDNFADQSLRDKIKKQGPMTVYFAPENGEADLIIQISNVNDLRLGGLVDTVQLGLQPAITKEAAMSRLLQILVSAIFFLHLIYAITIYFLGRGKYQKELLYFSALLFLSGTVILLDDDAILQLPLTDGFFTRILILLLLLLMLATLKFIHKLFQSQSRFSNILYLLFIPAGIMLLISSLLFKAPIQAVLIIYELTVVIQLIRVTLLAIKQGRTDGIFILLYMLCFISNIVWGTAIQLSFISIPYYPFDYIVSIMVIALLLFKRHMRIVALNDEQTRKLERADRQKDIFLANTSHELRNPLHGILNIAQAVLEDKSEQLTVQNRENLDLLLQIGRRMAFTLNDLLDLSRLDEGQIRLDLKSLSIHGVASAAADMIHFMKDSENVEIKIEIPEDFPNVNADENRFFQILFNLLHNAIKYTETGRITIGASHENETATIFVKDTGRGMKAEEVSRIFSRYEQAGSMHSEGIGLGLNICKQLIELHGGTIRVASLFGVGTTFYFTLPLAQTTSSQEAFEESTPFLPVTLEAASSVDTVQLPLSNINILVVDDDPVNLKVLRNILGKTYRVFTARNGKEALELLSSKRWSLIISDVMMPYMSGFEFTRKIREQYTISELPVLLLTARNQIADIYTGFQAGANDYVSKPTDAVELKTRVKALITLNHSIIEQFQLEAAWLQAQIKPHFLFNTLNTIASLGELDQERMVELLHEFGNYLKCSFNTENTRSLIPIEDELQLVRSYLFIEKERFGGRLNITWELGDHKGIQIPPLSIQTLTENAVNHGVLKLAEGGIITIKIINHRSFDTIIIEDNGAGIPPEKLQKILDKKNEHERGIGIVNTDRRLRQLFGNGLRINSHLGVGTQVSFDIPRNQD